MRLKKHIYKPKHLSFICVNTRFLLDQDQDQQLSLPHLLPLSSSLSR